VPFEAFAATMAALERNGFCLRARAQARALIAVGNLYL